MKRSRYTEEQIIGILKEIEAGQYGASSGGGSDRPESALEHGFCV
jgi:hypothetical protein